jgi:hypothetical protein
MSHKILSLENAIEGVDMSAHKKDFSRRDGLVRRRGIGIRAITLLMGLGFCSGGQAQWLTYDPATWLESYLDQYQGVIQDAKTLQHYASEIQHMQQTVAYWQSQLVKLKSLFSNYLLPDGVPLTEVDPRYMVEEKCGDEGLSFNLSGLMKVVKMTVLKDMGPKDLKTQQAEICAYIQMLKNKKFNESIEFNQVTVADLNGQLLAIDSRRNASDEQGNMSAAMYDAISLLNRSQVLAQDWEARMASYDAYIAIMEERQNMLAKQALKGKDNVLGTVVKNLALKAALEVK